MRFELLSTLRSHFDEERDRHKVGVRLGLHFESLLLVLHFACAFQYSAQHFGQHLVVLLSIKGFLNIPLIEVLGIQLKLLGC
jgi:hypothetical protein